MSVWIVYSIGFLAQLLYSARTLLQWIISEKSKKVITPSLFWKISLGGSFLMFIYGFLRDDFAIMLGQCLTYYIYIRNLQLQGEWKTFSKGLRFIFWIFPAVILALGYSQTNYTVDTLFNKENIALWLLLLGTVAQVIFTFRFIYQWIYSERKKESSLPMGFWLLSLTGSTLILVYGFFRKDPVLIAGHLFGAVVYIRNIILGYNERK